MRNRHPAAVGRVSLPSMRWSALYRLPARGIWEYLRTQSPSYWLVCIYLFLEYVRPQSIYDSISGLPWAFWTVIVCLAAFFFEGHRLRLWTLGDTCLALFTTVVLISSVLAVYPDDSFQQLSLYLSWVLIYFLITNIVNTEERFLVFVLSFLLYNLKMSMFATRSWAAIGFHFRDWGTVGGPGWFNNSGEFGIEMTIFLPIATHFVLGLRRHWGAVKQALFWIMPATAAVGMVASSSRGALLGGLAVLLWVLFRTRYKLRTAAIAVLVVAVVYSITPPEQKQRLDVMGSDPTSQARLTYWEDGIEIANEHPLFGIGYKNWLSYYHAHYNPTGQLPHNIFVEAGAELGYIGLAAFIGLIVATFTLNRGTRHLAGSPKGGGRFVYYMAYGLDGGLVGYLVSGFFVTVLYYPYFWINLAMTVALHNLATRRARQFALGEAHLTGQAIGHRKVGHEKDA